MSNEEAQKILDSMRNVMSENLTGEAKGLFEAIMKIADERDELRETVERQNLEIMAQKDARDFDAEITNDVNEIAVKLLKKLKEKNEITEMIINGGIIVPMIDTSTPVIPASLYPTTIDPFIAIAPGEDCAIATRSSISFSSIQ